MADMSALRLLRNDPEAAAEMLRAAEQGDVDAQYGMGLIYAEGRGFEQDEVRAYYWLSRAIDQGDTDARLLLQVVAFSMTADQIDQARLMLDDCHALPGQTAGVPGKDREQRGRRH